MGNNYNAQNEHKPFEKVEDKSRTKGGHPNKNRSTKHPVTGKTGN